MGKINDARKALLNTQMENAVVEHIGTEADDYPSYDVGTYSVFVPGGVREHNIVKAESEAEAKDKVKACLENKIDAMPETETTDSVAIDPDKLSVETKGLDQIKESE